MINKSKKVGLITVLIFLLVSIVSCGSMDGKNRKSDDIENNGVAKVKITEDYIPLTEIEEGRPDIYVIVKSMTSSYWQVVINGVKQAGIDKNCNVYAAGSTLETEWQLQEAYIDLAVERGADAIILGPDNSEMLSPVVEKVYKMGIPIIIVDTIVNTEKYDVCYMTDNLQAGENAAREMLRVLKEQGHTEQDKVYVAIQLGAKASQTINERLAGFCQYWTIHAPEGWKILDEIKCNDGDELLAKEISEKFFMEYPYVNGVFGTDNASSMGFSSAIMKLDKRDIVMVGFDYSPEVTEIIEDGRYVVSIMLQKQYQMGYNAVESALLINNGGQEKLKFFDTGVAVLNKDTMNSDEIMEIIKNNKGE
ncbi:MAG: substrate-binding domain-containing protein [Lachnospiraceae bacterium]|nr:substrate-binding domain-containing protein [Lachnospiraceae bacterium]